jgi:hypothetical protein
LIWLSLSQSSRSVPLWPFGVVDAIRAENGTRRRECLAAAIGDERGIGVQHGHQLLDVARDARVPELLHDLLRFTARHGEARMRLAQPAARAFENLPRVRLALADAPRDLVEVELEHLAQQVNRALGKKYSEYSGYDFTAVDGRFRVDVGGKQRIIVVSSQRTGNSMAGLPSRRPTLAAASWCSNPGPSSSARCW